MKNTKKYFSIQSDSGRKNDINFAETEKGNEVFISSPEGIRIGNEFKIKFCRRLKNGVKIDKMKRCAVETDLIEVLKGSCI